MNCVNFYHPLPINSGKSSDKYGYLNYVYKIDVNW